MLIAICLPLLTAVLLLNYFPDDDGRITKFYRATAITNPQGIYQCLHLLSIYGEYGR
ncbi:hypothetical protein [Candidatus Leptofilum sp.]|uniref:hypothetical protein n=1 Tax=Candidatus Leptofilum sp. TaxID=3241576 RepID=UPI003B5CF6C5